MDPAFSPQPDLPIIALAVSGSTVYAGGAFTSIGGQARNRIAALDAATGSATVFNANAAGEVRALAVAATPRPPRRRAP